MKAKEIVRPTQKQLVEEIGLSQSYASELLSGKKLPSLRVASLISHRLGYPITEWKVEL